MPAAPEFSARYLAWLYSHPRQRLLLQALLGIEKEISASARPGLDHQVAHSRLQWWREECERAVTGKALHPLTQEALRAFQAPVSEPNAARPSADTSDLAGKSPLSGLAGLVDTATWDLAGATFESRDELSAYCERWAGAMIEPIAVHALGAASGPDWRRCGALLRELELLADLAAEARGGRLRVPLDELDRAGVDPAALATPPWPPALAQLLAERIELLSTALAAGAGTLDKPEQLELRGLLVWIAAVSRTARRMRAALPDSRLPGRLDPLADTWFAWRAARRATTGHFDISGQRREPEK